MAAGDQSNPTTEPVMTALGVNTWRMPDGKTKVMLIVIRDSHLQISVMLTPEQAEKIAAEFLDKAREIRSGIVRPGGAGSLTLEH